MMPFSSCSRLRLFAPPPADGISGGCGGGGCAGGGGGGGLDADEQLALALMQQFAADLEAELGHEIPEEVRSDPQRYDAFVQEHLERALQGGSDTALARRANNLVDSNQAVQRSGGKTSFLEKLRGRAKVSTTPLRATSTRVKVVSVAQGGSSASGSLNTGLLSDQDQV